MVLTAKDNTTMSVAKKTAQIINKFEFETARIDQSGEIHYKHHANWGYSETLSEDIRLALAYIPVGTFIMGAPHYEKGREMPQHEVTIQPFSMGRYPVTQSQWRIVAKWPQVVRPLNQNPSCFDGDDLPVEGVSWYDAKEFCARLTKLTGKLYRLPSEAEWEYACRAGTTTPFYFGQLLTTNLVNYNGYYSYNGSPNGENRGETTEVGFFPANRWGLHDMHGQVWEWCDDSWHDNCNGAPTDGSAWTKGGNIRKVIRGGSWFSDPGYCRSAYRDCDIPGGRYHNIGFRVCCDVTEILISQQ